MREINLFIHGLTNKSSRWDFFIKILHEECIKHKNKSFIKEENYSSENNSYFYTFLDYDSEIYGFDNPIVNVWRDIKGRKDVLSDYEIDDIVSLCDTKIRHLSQNYDVINIFSYSLGGVVIMRWMMNNLNSKEIKKINKVLFFAAPFLGSDDPDKLNMYGRSKIKRTKILLQLSRNSDYIQKLVTSIKRENINELKLHYFYGINDNRIVDPRNLIDNRMEVNSYTDDHKSIIDLTSDSDKKNKIFDIVFNDSNSVNEEKNNSIKEDLDNFKYESYFEKCPPAIIDEDYNNELSIGNLGKEYKKSHAITLVG